MIQWPDLKFPPINHLTVWPTNEMCQIHEEYQDKVMNESIDFKLATNAKLPVRGTPQAAGLDIHSMELIALPGGERYMFHTGVYLADCPEDIYLRVAPRSKLANKQGINVLAGVVDCDYRGEVCVILHNTSSYTYVIEVGDAIAQLIPEQIKHYDVREVREVTESVRGEAGINSVEQRR